MKIVIVFVKIVADLVTEMVDLVQVAIVFVQVIVDLVTEMVDLM